MSYPEGNFAPITTDTNNYVTFSLSGDGYALAAIQSQLNAELDILPSNGAFGISVPGLAKLLQQTRDVQWINDREVVLIQPDRIIRAAVDGSAQTETFNNPDVSFGPAAVCDGGRTIVAGMLSRETGNRINIWRVGVDGSNLKRLTDGETEVFPLCWPGGKVFYYDDAKTNNCMRLSLEGGVPETVPCVAPPGSSVTGIQAVSRDGRLLAASGNALDSATNIYNRKFAIKDVSSATATPVCLDADPRVSSQVFCQFTPDGKALVYAIRAENNVDNLWLQPLDGKPGRPMTFFKSDQIHKFSWSPDGTELLVGRGHIESDIVLLRDVAK